MCGERGVRGCVERGWIGCNNIKDALIDRVGWLGALMDRVY